MEKKELKPTGKACQLWRYLTLLTLAAGCASHGNDYYTVYKPELGPKKAVANNNLKAAPATNAPVTAIASAQPAPASTNEHLYTEAPQSSLTPVSSRSVTHLYSEPAPQSETFSQVAGSSSSAGDQGWNPLDHGATPQDRTLIRQIRQKLGQDKTLSNVATVVKISADKGKVDLSGVVSTDEQKERMEAVAEGNNGVVTVNNQLMIKQ